MKCKRLAFWQRSLGHRSPTAWDRSAIKMLITFSDLGVHACQGPDYSVRILMAIIPFWLSRYTTPQQERLPGLFEYAVLWFYKRLKASGKPTIFNSICVSWPFRL